MTSDEANSGGGSVSVGQDDPERERPMEEEQRRQDDGIGVPPEANPHAEINERKDKRPVNAAKPAVRSTPNPESWKSHLDDPDHPGQTPDGGLGGGGPVQP